MHTDLIIIGAGPGGYRAAEYAAQNGLNVVVFEEAFVGGTCLNVGCIPTKAFAHDADFLLQWKESCLNANPDVVPAVDFAKVVERKDNVVESLRVGIETLLANPNIQLVRAKATFKDAKTVVADGQVFEADHIIIATGSKSKKLRLVEEPSRAVLDSSDLLSMNTLPQSICIIGAGVIGMEFASILNAFGVKVSVVEFLKECLPVLDDDIAKRLRKSLEKRGVDFYMQSAVTQINDEGVVFTDKKGRESTVQAEQVLMAVGREPLTQGLELHNAGILTDGRGAVVVDKNSFKVKTDSSKDVDIYAIGDVNGMQMLAHAAEMQAIHVVNQIIGRKDDIRFDVMPAAIFTNPEAACVGVTEQKCKADGLPYKCNKAFWRANGKALAMNETEGMLKLLSDENGLIIGCHAFGSHAADIIQEVAALMCRNTFVQQLADIIHIHPTLAEILHDAAAAG